MLGWAGMSRVQPLLIPHLSSVIYSQQTDFGPPQH